MRAEGKQLMDSVLNTWQGNTANLLDVGSYDVNGNFRDIVTRRGWQYTGLDIAAGPNVDVVTADPYKFPFPDQTFDIVISGYAMEHVEAIWLWVPELVRVLKPGGLLAIITHHAFFEHRYPVDCWRIMPDGMRFLFDQTERLKQYDIRIVDQYDILGAAWKAN
jgi:SAM-dependent methyltransferase